MQMLGLSRIQEVLPSVDLVREIEAGLVAYSHGEAVVPPVSDMVFEDPPGDVHIKSGYIRGDDYYVIKIASGFYKNPRIGLASSNGMMLLFEQATGVLVAIVHDEGYLTDVRTAVTGLIAARYLAPEKIHRIGVLGTGTQARMQLEYLRQHTDCREVLAWGRRREALRRYRRDLAELGYRVKITREAGEIGATCNLIVTATPSTAPILSAAQLAGGVHITAVGADSASKQELDPTILGRADLVVADSRAQCLIRGESAHAVRAGVLDEMSLREIGEVIGFGRKARTSDDQITVADLTGVAVQDIAVATAVYRAAQSASPRT